MEERLSHEAFIKKAIISLRKEGFKGIHTVYSGFNEAFKKYFPGEDPVEATNAPFQRGKDNHTTGKGRRHALSP